jgi:hypothetical protein
VTPLIKFCGFCLKKRPMKYRFIIDGKPEWACFDCMVEEFNHRGEPLPQRPRIPKEFKDATEGRPSPELHDLQGGQDGVREG